MYTILERYENKKTMKIREIEKTMRKCKYYLLIVCIILQSPEV